MQRHIGSGFGSGSPGTPSPAEPSTQQAFGKLIGTLFDPRRIFSEPSSSQEQHSRQFTAGHDTEEDGVPELLKPSIEYYSAKWASVQRRHDASVCICKEVDERLYRLQLLLQRHDEAASAMAREILQLAETKKQLDAIRTQAESIRPVIAMLDDLYAQLAESDTSWSADLVEQESRYRQGRHQHYMQLQQTMDEQYAEMCRESVQMRAENAARSFQRDLDSYVLQQQQQWNADGNRTLLPGAKTGASAGGPSVADVVVTLSGDVEDTFFSDDDDAGHKTSTTNTALKKQQQQQQQVAARNQDGSRSPSPPGIAILQDEDFD